MDTISLLTDTFAPLDGKRLLDIGCGGGYLARTLLARGAIVTGIDPGEAAIATARSIAPQARFEVASADSLPFPDGSFEGIVFLNSLHHVPAVAMDGALAESARTSAPGGLVAVVEPLAQGSFFAAFRPIEDETQVRRQAQEALGRALASGRLRSLRDVTFVRREAFATFDQFLDRASAAEPSRRAVIAGNRAEIERAFGENAVLDAQGRHQLDQPLRAVILSR